MFSKTLKTILFLILASSTSFAESTGYVNLNGTPSFVSKDGKDIIVGTEGDDDFKVVQNQVTTFSIDGVTGAVSFQGGVTSSSSAFQIATDSNSKRLQLGGGTAASISNGANLYLYGITAGSGTIDGDWYLRSGDTTSGGTGHLSGRVALKFQRNQGGYQDLWTLDAATGTWTSDATNGGNIVFGTASPLIGSAGSLGLQLTSDANRLVTFTGASDTDLNLKFGDGGTTATQIFAISGSTADADDDSELRLCGAGLCNSSSRGATLSLYGNEKSSGGIYAFTGSTAGSDIILAATDDFIVETVAGADALVIDTATAAATFSGNITSSATGTLGWSIVNAANQACTTTCTSACVFGMNTGALGNFTSCSDATSDTCVCAGAS